MALTYTFQMPGNTALRPVTVFNSAGVQQTTGTLDEDAVFTAELEVGDYFARATSGRTTYEQAGTVDRGDEDAFGSGGGGGSTDFTGTTPAETFLTSKVTGDAGPRFEVRADGATKFSNGANAPEPEATGFFYQVVPSYDYGVGEPFQSGDTHQLVIGDPDDPWGFDTKTGDVGDVQKGYIFRINGGFASFGAAAIFDDYQPFLVLGRLNQDMRYPEIRPRGETEELAIGIARTTTDYFYDVQPGDVILRAYGAGPGAAATQRRRRIYLGSNDGGQAEYGHSTMSVGSADVQMYRPLNFINSAVADPTTGKVYVMIAGKRWALQAAAEPIQASDTFTGENGHGLVSTDTGQDYYLATGTWQKQGGKAYALNLTNGKAMALLTIAADSTLACDITPAGAVNAATLAHRVTDGSGTTFIHAAALLASDTVSIQKVVNGIDTTLASAALPAWADGVTRRLSLGVVGNDITVKIDGVTVVTHTLAGADATLFAGAANCGMVVYDTVTAFDNLKVTI